MSLQNCLEFLFEQPSRQKPPGLRIALIEQMAKAQGPAFYVQCAQTIINYSRPENRRELACQWDEIAVAIQAVALIDSAKAGEWLAIMSDYLVLADLEPEFYMGTVLGLFAAADRLGGSVGSSACREAILATVEQVITTEGPLGPIPSDKVGNSSYESALGAAIKNYLTHLRIEDFGIFCRRMQENQVMRTNAETPEKLTALSQLVLTKIAYGQLSQHNPVVMVYITADQSMRPLVPSTV